MGTWMRAREVRRLLEISAWDLRMLVELGQLKACWPLGRKLGKGKAKRTKRGRPAGERVPYYRRSEVEGLQGERLE